MTLGTNASLEERITYAPDEVNPNEILAALQELEEWRLLGDTPGDVKEQIDSIETLEGTIEKLNFLVGDFEEEVSFLKNQIEELQDQLSIK